jgi:hypothetical protein
VRAGVLAWSAVSGLVVGVLGGAALFGVLAVGAAFLPATLARLAERLRAPALVLCFLVLPALGAVVGYLEGRLKLR